jgi:hypothetical protein
LFAILAAVVTIGGLAIVTWSAGRLAQRFPSRRGILAVGLLFLYVAALLLRPNPWVLIDLSVLLGAVGGVLLIEPGFREPRAVLVFLIVAAVVDLVSMSGGLSRMIVTRYRQGTSDLLLYLTLVIPVRGRVVPIVGFGDLLVGGVAATALIRLGFGSLTVMTTLAAGLVAALAYGLWRGGAPALPFIAVAVLVLMSATRRSSHRAEVKIPRP